MISKEQIATIRRLYYAEHWKVGTIAAEMRLHPETVKRALLNSSLDLRTCRPDVLNPWLDFIRQTLDQHPHLRATRLYEMLRGRGYQGSIRQVRRMAEKARPRAKPFSVSRFYQASRAKPTGLLSARSASAAPSESSPASSLPSPIAGLSTWNSFWTRRSKACCAATSMPSTIGRAFHAPSYTTT